MSKWKRGIKSLLWVVLAQSCTLMIPLIWWMLFNPLEPYTSTMEIVGSTIMTLLGTIALPIYAVICYGEGLNLKEEY